MDGWENPMTGQVCDFKEPYWRVRYPDGDREELMKMEVMRYGQQILRVIKQQDLGEPGKSFPVGPLMISVIINRADY